MKQSKNTTVSTRTLLLLLGVILLLFGTGFIAYRSLLNTQTDEYYVEEQGQSEPESSDIQPDDQSVQVQDGQQDANTIQNE